MGNTLKLALMVAGAVLLGSLAFWALKKFVLEKSTEKRRNTGADKGVAGPQKGPADANELPSNEASNYQG